MIDAEQVEELREIRRLPIAIEIGFRDTDIATLEEPRREIVIFEHHAGGGRRFEAAQTNYTAVGQSDVKRTALQSRGEAKRQPYDAGQVGENVVDRVRGHRNQIRHSTSINAATRSKRPCEGIHEQGPSLDRSARFKRASALEELYARLSPLAKDISAAFAAAVLCALVVEGRRSGSLTTMAVAVPAQIATGARVVGPMASRAAVLIGRGSDHDLRRVGQRRAVGVATQHAGGAHPCGGGIGGEVAREEAVGGDVAVVIAIIVIP